MKTFLGLTPLLSALFYASKELIMQTPPTYVISPNWTAVENFWWNFSLIRKFSWGTITDVHWYLDCLNFNCCPVRISNKTHLSTSKVFPSNCLFVNYKPQTNTADKRVLLLQTKDKTHSFFDDNHQRVCGSLKIYSVFWENFVVFWGLLKKMVVDDRVLCIIWDQSVIR